MRENLASGFEVSIRRKTMTMAISTPSRNTGTVRTHTHFQAQNTATAAGHQAQCVGTVDRQAAIENALSMALYFMRQSGDTAANLWAATARANRALTLLKQASEGR
jgi:hypothetical protein